MDWLGMAKFGFWGGIAIETSALLLELATRVLGGHTPKDLHSGAELFVIAAVCALIHIAGKDAN